MILVNLNFFPETCSFFNFCKINLILAFKKKKQMPKSREVVSTSSDSESDSEVDQKVREKEY